MSYCREAITTRKHGRRTRNPADGPSSDDKKKSDRRAEPLKKSSDLRFCYEKAGQGASRWAVDPITRLSDLAVKTLDIAVESCWTQNAFRQRETTGLAQASSESRSELSVSKADNLISTVNQTVNDERGSRAAAFKRAADGQPKPKVRKENPRVPIHALSNPSTSCTIFKPSLNPSLGQKAARDGRKKPVM